MNLKEIMASDSSIVINSNDLATTFIYRKYSDASEFEVEAVMTMPRLNQGSDGRGLPTQYSDNAIVTLVLDFQPKTYDELEDSDGVIWKVSGDALRIANRWRVNVFKNEKPTGFGSVPRY